MSKQNLTDRQLASGVTLTDLVHIVILRRHGRH